MEKIIAARGTGKTKKLILSAAEHDGIIVCANPDAMITKAHAFGITGLRVIDYFTFLYDNDFKVADSTLFYIDEVEHLVAAASRKHNGKAGGFTVCSDDD